MNSGWGKFRQFNYYGLSALSRQYTVISQKGIDTNREILKTNERLRNRKFSASRQKGLRVS